MTERSITLTLTESEALTVYSAMAAEKHREDVTPSRLALAQAIMRKIVGSTGEQGKRP